MNVTMPDPECQSTRTDHDIGRIDWGYHIKLGGVILTLTIVDVIWLALSPIQLDWAAASLILLIPLILAMISFIYLHIRPAPSLGITSLALAELFAFSVPGVIFSCLMTSLGQPLMDESFASWDASLSFDWAAYVNFIASRPWLNMMLAMLYVSPRYQICILAAILSITGRHLELNRLIGNLILGAILISIVGGLMPALGGYVHFGMPERDVFNFADTIRAFHGGGAPTIDLTHVKGIITFPSYHAAMSIAVMLASRSVLYLRYPVLIINAALIAGVPVHGAHYLVDIIAGAAVILIVDQLWRWMGASQPARRQISFAN